MLPPINGGRHVRLLLQGISHLAWQVLTFATPIGRGKQQGTAERELVKIDCFECSTNHVLDALHARRPRLRPTQHGGAHFQANVCHLPIPIGSWSGYRVSLLPISLGVRMRKTLRFTALQTFSMGAKFPLPDTPNSGLRGVYCVGIIDSSKTYPPPDA